MAELQINSSTLGNNLQQLLVASDIQPGDSPSYQLCKTIFLYHPLGAKMVEAPIRMAQSQQREINIPASPEERVRDQFLAEWKKLNCDAHIFNGMSTARMYGISSVAIVAKGVPEDRPIDLKALPTLDIAFHVFDPLNTSGSLVLNQNPLAFDFQKVSNIAVSSKAFHPSRACVVMNENPIYIAYTGSAFGFVGRSVYQRALFPLKSFVQSMVTDDMVTRKAGLLIAMLKSVGSITDRLIQRFAGIKRSLLQAGATNNVLSIDNDEKIETLNMQNTDNAMTTARTNILKNIATAADMPAMLLENETMTEGFGEGTEDAKHIARYIKRFREEMDPLYRWFDNIVMYRAWTPEFYETIQAEFPAEYGKMSYRQAFFQWVNSFSANWPNLLEEPDSEKIKVEETKYKTILGTAEVLLPEVDPENKATVVGWLCDNLNENKMIFTSPLELDLVALAAYVPPAQQALDMAGEEEPKPKGRFAGGAT